MTKQKHIDLIDLLKGFAIISVIYFHSGFSDEVSKAVIAPFLFNLAKPIFTILGKASYHIFLMQMLYFGIVMRRINISKPSVNFIIAVLFSVSLGLIMYFAENQVIKIIKNKRSKSV